MNTVTETSALAVAERALHAARTEEADATLALREARSAKKWDVVPGREARLAAAREAAVQAEADLAAAYVADEPARLAQLDEQLQRYGTALASFRSTSKTEINANLDALAATLGRLREQRIALAADAAGLRALGLAPEVAETEERLLDRVDQERRAAAPAGRLAIIWIPA